MRPIVPMLVLALAVGSGAHAQTKPPAAAVAASAARPSTAPTSPTARIIDAARPPEEAGRDTIPAPQIAVPLKRATPDPVALKPGKRERPSGTVDDAAARCLADRGSGAQGRCSTAKRP